MWLWGKGGPFKQSVLPMKQEVQPPKSSRSTGHSTAHEPSMSSLLQIKAQMPGARSFPRVLVLTPPLLPGLSSQPTPPPPCRRPPSTPPPHWAAPHSPHPRLPLTSAPALCLQRASLHSLAPMLQPRWGRPSHPASLSAARSKFLL